ncbi:hypothetical protein J6590_056491 [Homalodisca vitripennis]|nr:hypothetical protein J6590_056491 [Homalodisca vitripennis]
MSAFNNVDAPPLWVDLAKLRTGDEKTEFNGPVVTLSGCTESSSGVLLTCITTNELYYWNAHCP